MSFLSGLINLLLGLFGLGSTSAAISQAERIVVEATEAWLRNIAEIGIQDGARFIADARELSAQIQAKEVGGGEKLKLYLGSIDNLAVMLGGDIAHTVWESVRRTAAELMHQPDVSKGA